jgi:hypothetical protein
VGQSLGGLFRVDRISLLRHIPKVIERHPGCKDYRYPLTCSRNPAELMQGAVAIGRIDEGKHHIGIVEGLIVLLDDVAASELSPLARTACCYAVTTGAMVASVIAAHKERSAV